MTAKSPYCVKNAPRKLSQETTYLLPCEAEIRLKELENLEPLQHNAV